MQCIVRLGTLIPSEQVPELLVFLTGVHVSVDTVRRITERAGAAQVAIEDREIDRLEAELPAVPAGPAHPRCQLVGQLSRTWPFHGPNSRAKRTGGENSNGDRHDK